MLTEPGWVLLIMIVNGSNVLPSDKQPVYFYTQKACVTVAERYTTRNTFFRAECHTTGAPDAN